jgi:hypothetical protein
MPDRSLLRRLNLQLERDLLARAQLQVLVTAADASVAGHRQELRNLKARLARRSLDAGRNK